MKIVSWDGNAINNGTSYTSHLLTPDALPAAEAALVARAGKWPVFSGLVRPGWFLPLEIIIENLTNLTTLQKQLHQWFDPEDETSKQLMVEDDDGTDDRYLYAVCVKLTKDPRGAGNIYVAMLAVDGDPRFRHNTLSTDQFLVTATGQTDTWNNSGEDDAYPVIEITPTSNRTATNYYEKKRFAAVNWRAPEGATNYPVDIVSQGFDTAAETTADMQADGDDLRVFVDGVEVERWLNDMDTVNTGVWCNLDFEAAPTGIFLGEAIASSGALDYIQAYKPGIGADDQAPPANLDLFPDSGILQIDVEWFVYTSINRIENKFLGITRAAFGSSMAAHTTADNIYWIQHQIWIVYDKSTATAPVVDSANEPAFAVDTSTNSQWDYTSFGSYGASKKGKPGAWQFESLGGAVVPYTGDHGAMADPWAEIGQRHDNLPVGVKFSRWFIYNPCGIAQASYSVEKYKAAASALWVAAYQSRLKLDSPWIDEGAISTPTANDAWQSQSASFSLTSGSHWYGIRLLTQNYVANSSYSYLENTATALALDTATVPTTTLGAETNNYELECLITNQTTGDVISLHFQMALNETLVIDTDAKTITYLDDGSDAFQALTVIGERGDWLKLVPGNNTIKFEEVGTQGVTIDVEWRRRYYS